MASAGERVCVGRIGAAHGTRGEVKLWSFTADPMAIRDYGALATEDGTRTFTIETLRPGRAAYPTKQAVVYQP
jgi:16S rRNA processing protein RimM